MAAVGTTADIMTIHKDSQILVKVEEALADLIVVSYCTEDKKFQGVLLDSNKGNLPFGVYNLHPAFNKQAAPAVSNNKLHSVSQRFLYESPDYEIENARKPKKPGPKSKPQQRQKMTVRLRPRKVLCSNCQGICNENSENVDVSKKRKLDSEDDAHDESETSKVQKKYSMGSMLIPKLSRLQPSEISSALKGPSKLSIKASEKQTKPLKNGESEASGPELTFVSVPNSTEDDQDPKNEDTTFSSMFSSARTLKICFGEGEGTVVKIPPLTGEINEDSGVSCDMSKIAKPESKAAKKALKRARKQAKKTNAVDNPQVTVQSPRHKGALSPRNTQLDSPPSDPLEKRHKHKVKHKKKCKSQKKRDENLSKSVDRESVDFFDNIKEHCMKQKLCISLRRLSSNSYERRSDNEGESGSEEWEDEMVPDFPADSSEGVGGRLLRVTAGDIVWGKVTGFPWWPGRVLSVTSTSRAHVEWFASTTTSLMPCDSLSPFLEDYSIRFNKKKRGPYKEAVKQATIEAKQNESHVSDPLASPTHLASVSPRPIDVFS